MPKLYEYKKFNDFEKCNNIDNYFCKCKNCKNAIAHAKYIFQREIDEEYEKEVRQQKIKDCETSCGKLTIELMKEVI